MNGLIDRDGALSSGLADIRTQFAVPTSFPEPVLAEAKAAAGRPIAGHADWTDRDFATLDPAASTDLDQAFSIERSGQDLILHYAIADVAWFVSANGAVDLEAWTRGTTIYMPDGKASLYPPGLSEGAASLLPGVERPSVVFRVRIDPTGKAVLDGAVRAVIRSRSKLAYETVTPADLPPDFAELSRRIEQAEDVRGAARVDAPEQQLGVDASGYYALEFRPQNPAEVQNAAMSLAANLAIADLLLAHRTGLFRVMPEPEEWAVHRLRHTAKALGLDWPHGEGLKAFERRLDQTKPREAAFMAAVRRAGPRASYAPYREGTVPWHSAMAATYAHATAPLRRLQDRYVIEAVLQIASGGTVSGELRDAFERLPAVMARAEEKAGQVDRAVLDLAEAAVLQGRQGSRFTAVVTDIDERGARIQLTDLAVVSRVDGHGALPGDTIMVELVSADVAHRQVKFERVD
jgi:exoribonuclease R